jgi:hypothetical protein
MRSRWLLHAAERPPITDDLGSGVPESWTRLITELVAIRREGTELEEPEVRTRLVDPEAANVFLRERRRWIEASLEPAPLFVTEAFGKADTHLLRIAGILAEADEPGGTTPVSAETMERAARWVDFTIDCWRAQTDTQSLGLSWKDKALDAGVNTWRAYIDKHGGAVTRRQMQMHKIAGANTALQFQALLAHYEATYPGCVTNDGWVRAPGHPFPLQDGE